MGRFKDAFFFEVWKHLLSRPGQPAQLSALNSATSGLHAIRNAWQELQANLKEEGLKKGTGMKVVLGERPDLFDLSPVGTGHPSVVAQLASTSFDPAEGLPSKADVLGIAAAAASIEKSWGAEGATGGAAAGSTDLLTALGFAGPAAASATATEILGADGPLLRPPPDVLEGAITEVPASILMPTMPLFQTPGLVGSGMVAVPTPAEPKKKKAKTAASSSATASSVAIGKSGYNDLIWTPLLAAVKQREDNHEKDMARALLSAVENYNGATVNVAKLGFDHRVARMKKDNKFKNEKLIDIVRRHEDVFELVPDGAGGWNVRVQPGAMAVLYEEGELAAKLEAEAMLPPKMKDAFGAREKMQALRVELIHALHHRGGRGTIQELGQEPGVQQNKQNIIQAKKLQDFVKLFPLNFHLTMLDGNMFVQLQDYFVGDMSMIDHAITQSNLEFRAQKGSGKGKGRGFGRGMSRGPGNFPIGNAPPRNMPMHHAMPALGMGMGFSPPGVPMQGFSGPFTPL